MNAANVTSILSMTHHDLISSYIDNELSREQEQEFLISLAASDNLRSSFRTELTLKNIVHRDESLITPPRALRASVFAAVGLGAAAAPEVAQAAAETTNSTTAVASQSSAFFKGLFATKLNALFTTLTLSVATLVGYVGNDVITNEPEVARSTETRQPSAERVAAPVTEKAQVEQTVAAEKPVASAAKQTGSRIETRVKTSKPAVTTSPISNEATTPQTDAVTDPATSIPGEVNMDPIQINSPKK